MIIAFIGPDGSGKTTYVKKLQNHLINQGYKVKIRYPFNYFLLRKFIDFFKKKNNIKHNKIESKNSNFFLKFWPILVIVDNYLDYICNLKFYSGIVICERYYYDLATSYSEFGYTFSWLYDIYLKLIPKPDKCIVLNAKPEILQNRETGTGKHNKKFFISQFKRYTYIANKFNFNKIDSQQHINHCFNKIINITNINRIKFSVLFNYLAIAFFAIFLFYLYSTFSLNNKNVLLFIIFILSTYYQKIDIKINMSITLLLCIITTYFASYHNWEMANLFGIYTYYFFLIAIVSELTEYIKQIFNEKK
jgi:thymidylate kinase